MEARPQSYLQLNIPVPCSASENSTYIRKPLFSGQAVESWSSCHLDVVDTAMDGLYFYNNVGSQYRTIKTEIFSAKISTNREMDTRRTVKRPSIFVPKPSTQPRRPPLLRSERIRMAMDSPTVVTQPNREPEPHRMIFAVFETILFPPL